MKSCKLKYTENSEAELSAASPRDVSWLWCAWHGALTWSGVGSEFTNAKYKRKNEITLKERWDLIDTANYRSFWNLWNNQMRTTELGM